MRKRKISLYAIALVALVLASCKDYIEFDQNAYDDYVKDAFVVDNVDPNHQWATVEVATARIAVATGNRDAYKVKIYDENPIGYQGTLKLLGVRTCPKTHKQITGRMFHNSFCG